MLYLFMCKRYSHSKYGYAYCRDIRLTLLQQTHWMPVIKKEYLESITIGTFKAFYTEFKSHLFTEGYVHGNFTPEVSGSVLEQHNYCAHLFR